MYYNHDSPDAEILYGDDRSRDSSRVSSLSSYSADTYCVDDSNISGVPGPYRPAPIHITVTNMSNTLNQKRNYGDRSDKDRRNNTSKSRTQENSNSNALGNGHLIDGINLGDLEGDTSDSDADHAISTADLMFSMLQVESDGSDVASSTDVIPNNTKRRMKSIARRQKDLTVFDAILGARRSAKRVSSQEKTFTQRRNKAIDDYSGPKAHVTATNKDQKRVLFKDNTRLLQTIKAHTGAIWALKFSPDGKYLATGGQDGKLIVWTVGLPPDGISSPQSSRKGSDSSGPQNSNSAQSSDADKDMGADTIPDDFNSAFNSSTHSVEKHSAGNITGFERRSSDGKSVGGGPKGFGLAGGGCDGIDIHGHTSVHPNSHIHSTRLPGGQSSSSSPRRHSGFEFRDRDGDSEKRSSNTGGGIIRSSSPLPEFGSRDNSGKENPEFGSSISPTPSLSPVRKTSALRPQRPVDIVKDKENNKERRKGSGLEHTRDVDNGSDICEELNERSDVGNDGDDNSDDSGDDEMLESGRNRSGKDKEGEGEIKTIPFLWPTPLRILFGHTQDVIDISWSKSHFILSASADHNVRLWHVTRGDCLQVFRHPDIATSIDFHPLHDRYFISGCFDRRLRVWDIISDARTKEWVSLSETVTSVSFSPDGSTVVGGLMNGQVYFYNYEGLKYLTQMNCRNRRGKFKKGTKVTGLSFLKTENEGLSVPRSYPFNTLPPLLVTTNDNRLRLFSLGDFSLRMKYKGVKNTHMQIKASFSDDGKFIVCGSEMGGIVVWETQPTAAASSLSFLFSEQQDRNCSCESILNNSNVPERQPKDKKRIVSSLIGQKNSKRIQSAFRSFATKKDRSRNLNANAGGFANVDLAAATTAAIFAPVSSILHCARSGTPADSPLGSNSASVKSNHPSECSATYAPVKSDALEIGQGQFDCGKQEPGSGVGIGVQNGNQASKIINALNHDGNIVSNGYRGGTGIGADERTGTESANITGTGTKCPPISTADVSRTEAKAGAAGGALRNSRGSRGTANKPAPDPVHQSNIIEVTEGREKEKEKKSQSPASCGTDSRENGEGEDLSSSLRQGQGKEREQSDSIPVPLSDLSSRVIVATDILGYIRVFVRSGKQSVDTKGKMISGMKQMRL